MHYIPYDTADGRNIARIEYMRWYKISSINSRAAGDSQKGHLLGGSGVGDLASRLLMWIVGVIRWLTAPPSPN